MLGRLRAACRPFVHALAAPLARAGVSPHAVTLSAIPFAIGAALAVHAGWYGVGFAFGLLAALADLVDGTVAHLQNRASPFGNYFETMVDKVVDVILIAGTVTISPAAALLACATSLLVSFAKARVGLVIIADNRDWPAAGDRADRLTVLLSGFFLAAAGYPAIGISLWILVVLNLVGLAGRMLYARRLIEQATHDGKLLPYLGK
jgi:phosphatidylglycerophosphate synthase